MRTKLAVVVAAVSLSCGLLALPAQALTASQAMRTVVPSLQAKEVGLAKVLEHIHELTNANIIVNWKALEAVGVTKDTPITVDLHDLSLSKLLETILDDASATAQLTWQVDRNVIRVTSQAEADTRLMTRVYPVGDLLLPKNTEFYVPHGSQTNYNMTGQGNGVGQQPGTLFQPQQQTGGGTQTGMNGQGKTIDYSKDREKAGQALIDVIQTAIRPEIWDKNGGKATARMFNNMLIIAAPESVQEAIGGPIRESERRFGF
jgi:hypothetical protein